MTSTRYMFIGDSVTDCGRREDPARLGEGYVRLIAQALADEADTVDVVNTGIGGDRVRDLRRRWITDCVAHDPDVVTVLIGINDTWRRYDADDPTTTKAFAADYRAILDVTRTELPRTRIVLMEPFLIPVTTGQQAWREDLDPKIAVVHELAAEYGAVLVRLDRMFANAVADRGLTRPTSLAADGVHPTTAGHRMIADTWLAATGGLTAGR